MLHGGSRKAVANRIGDAADLSADLLHSLLSRRLLTSVPEAALLSAERRIQE